MVLVGREWWINCKNCGGRDGEAGVGEKGRVEGLGRWKWYRW